MFKSIDPTYAIFLVILIGAGLFLVSRKQSGGKGKMSGKAVLDQFTTDLTKRAAEGKIEAVVGRDEEIERVIHILARKSKNNPLLLGEPGVGKTAIVEGLARRIARGSVPDVLKDKRLLSLDLPGMISGTKYRGEFEARMKHLTEELEGMGRRMILFIDEVHMLEQASGAEGALNVSDILKPALSRGELSAIGATTWKEYEATIKQDDALNRRFQPVLIGEPDREASLMILRAIRPAYEAHHNVTISDVSLVAAVDLSKKYIKDRFLPDKAIDLIDEAAAAVSIEAALGHKVPMGVVAEAARERAKRETEKLKLEISHMEELSKQFPSDIGIEKAERALETHLAELQSGALRSAKGGVPEVGKDDIIEVVSHWGNISKDRIK